VRTALVLHAHPDDEVFATGAATILLAEAGWRVVLRVATAGPTPQTVDALQASCPLLGISEWDYLVDDHRWLDDGGPHSLAKVDSVQLSTEITRTLSDLKPDLILSVGSDGLTGHPDHIAIATALQQAQRPCPVLGARLRATNVLKGHQLLQQVLPDEQVGSGRVQGVPDDVQLQAYTGGAEVAQRRRAALDQYYPGLGSQDLATLLETYPRRGDSLLLRAVFDASTWSSDEFE
jgi:LmbE family N-acetylglucosaminyl deacetylase